MEIEYHENGDFATVDGKMFRRDKRTGYFLSSRPIGEKRKRLHVYMWEKHNGKIPDGYDVHHKDHDKMNNEINNLELLTRSEHLRKHALEMTDERRQHLRDHVAKIRPLTKKWHASEEGKRWHSENGKNVWKNRDYAEYTCSHCGKVFETKNRYSEKSNRFCSNNCKSAFRRASGVDDVDIQCTICGETFRANKYSKRTKCMKCARIRRK